MRAVFGLVLIVGLGLAGAAVYLFQGLNEDRQSELAMLRQQAAQAVPTVDVIAVNRAVEYGEQLTSEDVIFVKYAEPFLPEGVFLTQEEFFSEGAGVYRSVVRPMDTNEPVLAAKVTEPGEAPGLSSTLGRGMSAFAIRVDVASGVSGFLRPGDRVDVYWTGRVETGDRPGLTQEVTRLVEPNVKLIAVDQNADGNRSGATIARTVTVEATRTQVGRLNLAQSTGRLSLALVPFGEEDLEVAAIEIDQRDLLGLEDVVEEAPEVVEQERVCTIRNNRGTEETIIEIPCRD